VASIVGQESVDANDVLPVQMIRDLTLGTRYERFPGQSFAIRRRLAVVLSARAILYP